MSKHDKVKKYGEKTTSVLGELKKFIFRGNVIDMAVGVIIGAAFSGIVNSLVKDIFTPLISAVFGSMNFDYLSFKINDAEIFYGLFLTQVINFLLVAVCLFFLIKFVNGITNSMKRKEEPAPAKPARKCPYCLSEIPDAALRCPHCTSDVADSAVLPE